MFDWLRELLEIRIEYKKQKIQLQSVQYDVTKITNDIIVEREREENICQSCETLKMQLAIANQEKKDLLNRILTPPVVAKPEVIVQNPRAVIPPRHNNFAIKRRALEAESRENARLLQDKAKEQTNLRKVTLKSEDVDHTTVEDLEDELDIAAETREAQSGVK